MASSRVVLRDLFGAEQDFSAFVWQPFRDGVEIARIYGDGLAGPSAALLRYAPGAQLPPHRHVDYEQIIVLSGSQRDEHGSYRAGTCLIHGPETGHQVASDEGCVVLAIWNSPVVFG
ncbi:MAG TPA: cupin domain-containing protein [Polyangiales bacterium]|nr:cupin domain-containing protein [Polyangiales bacterium]